MDQLRNRMTPRSLRRAAVLAIAALMALSMAVLGPAMPSTAVAPGQGYHLVRQFVVDGDNEMAVNPVTGDVYVVDSLFDRVKRYSPSGALLRSVDLPDDAWGVDVGPQGWVYVAWRNTVAVYHADLTLIGDFPEEDGGVADVALNPVNGDAYVTDTVDDEVIHYDAGGNELGRWGTTGSGAGQLDNPQSIAVGPAGDVYVGERENNRVSRFSATGTFLNYWGQLGTGNGQFNWPRGLATDAQGNVYVADFSDGAGTGGRVQIFTRTGGYLTSIGAYGAPPFSVFGPRDVDVDASGQVHVITTTTSPVNKVVATYAPVVPAAGTGHAKVVKPKGPVKLHGKKLRFTVKCAKGARCTGILTVSVKGKVVTKAKPYSIKPGKKKVITAKVTKKGLKVLRKKAVTKAVVTVYGAKRKVKIRR